MVISKETVEHIANLARIELTESEKEPLTAKLDEILAYVQELNQLDTTNLEPTSHALPIDNVFREDLAKDFDAKDLVIKNCPNASENAFLVPKIK